jgi:two-component system, NtrC family, sensor kinase
MNKHLQNISDIIQQSAPIGDESKSTISMCLKDADKELEIALFKLDRTEKVKRTTSILLKETIEELEQKRKAVEDSHDALKKSMEDLKAAQSQLIQSEKMASLGELTAGIAHEIQNPLNFVNNFSEVSVELVEEMKEELEEGNQEDVKEIAEDLKQNLQKISNHGNRASFIVNGMLEHSRTSTGDKKPTNINIIAEEFLKLSYHGLRAKDKSFNAEFETVFDTKLPLLNIVSQDIGRVILNLINNAFYAVDKKSKQGNKNYKPLVSVSSKKIGEKVEISVKDNGDGVPENIKEKIFQPFYTTKPTGEGTGLGLSLSYDIIKAHGGEIIIETEKGEGTEFRISLNVEQDSNINQFEN